jgi:hypothetical protein
MVGVAHTTTSENSLKKRGGVGATALLGLHISHAGIHQVTQVQAVIGIGLRLFCTSTGQPAQQRTEQIPAGGLSLGLGLLRPRQAAKQVTQEVTSTGLSRLLLRLLRTAQTAQERAEDIASGWLGSGLGRLATTDEGLEHLDGGLAVEGLAFHLRGRL